MADPICEERGASPVGTPAWWEARYRVGETPWDTGIVPPEVVQLVESGALAAGWALDLGCGSGVSSRFLAGHGFRVVGVDLAPSALARACRAAVAEELTAYFCAGDVVELGFLNVQATVALDIGCFHAVPGARRHGYVVSLARRLVPGSHYLLYAFDQIPAQSEAGPGVSSRDIAEFAPWFSLSWVQRGRDGERTSAWYLLRRTRMPAP